VQLTHTLLGLGLLDELHLAVHPVFLGRPDTHLLVREGGAATLEFVRATPLDSGVVMMEYRPKAA
jgi:riboflavin biosynthesis pyrimidine reductase